MTDFDKNLWRTPLYFFAWLDKRFNFNLDGCANDLNALHKNFIGDGGLRPDFLTFDDNEVCNLIGGYPLKIFVNPPYSEPLTFVKRAVELKQAGCLVVMLLPADSSTEWYKVIEESATEVINITGYHDEKGRFHSGRIGFINPVTKQEVKGNNKGSVVVVFDPTMQDFVQRSVSLDFVKKVGGYGA